MKKKIFSRLPQHEWRDVGDESSSWENIIKVEKRKSKLALKIQQMKSLALEKRRKKFAFIMLMRYETFQIIFMLGKL